METQLHVHIQDSRLTMGCSCHSLNPSEMTWHSKHSTVELLFWRFTNCSRLFTSFLAPLATITWTKTRTTQVRPITTAIIAHTASKRANSLHWWYIDYTYIYIYNYIYDYMCAKVLSIHDHSNAKICCQLLDRAKQIDRPLFERLEICFVSARVCRLN